MHFHRDVLANADTFSRHVLKPSPDDVFTGTPPLAFTFGLGGLVVFPLHAGAATLLIEKASPGRARRPHGVPRRHRVLHRADGLPRDAHRRARGATHVAPAGGVGRRASAGEHLAGVQGGDRRRDHRRHRLDRDAAHLHLRRPTTTSGRARRVGPCPGSSPRSSTTPGNPLPAGEIGRLAVKGPTGCRYLADDRQSVYVQNGWNITGDTFLRDEDGYFWYQARSDDMIISSGYNIAGPGGGGGAARPPRRDRVRRGRGARRGARLGGEGGRRAGGGLRRRRRAGRPSCRTS